MQPTLRSLWIGASFAVAVGPASAAVVWNETGNGDLSGDRLNPTLLTLTAGTNSLLATVGSGGDLDYFTFTLAAGYSLTAINLVSYSGTDGTAFIGLQTGTTFTEPASGTIAANLLGYAHIGPNPGNVGTDILDNIGVGAGSIGFTPPLPAGSYSFWVQQASATATTIQLDFQAIPEPGAVALLIGAAGLLATGVVRRWRSGDTGP